MQSLWQWKSSKYYTLQVCVHSLRYPACNVHVPYCHLWTVWLCNIFSHYLINGQFSGKKKKQLLNVKCVLWFSLQLSLKYFSLHKELSDIWSKMYIGLHVKYPLFLPDFNETWIFSRDFRKITLISNLMKICPVGAELYRADRWTDMTKLIVALCNFANAPKN